MTIGHMAFSEGEKFLRKRSLEGLPASDPLRAAVEAAVFFSKQPESPYVAALSASGALPVNATEFQRGIAYGIALTLAAEQCP